MKTFFTLLFIAIVLMALIVLTNCRHKDTRVIVISRDADRGYTYIPPNTTVIVKTMDDTAIVRCIK